MPTPSVVCCDSSSSACCASSQRSAELGLALGTPHSRLGDNKNLQQLGREINKLRTHHLPFSTMTDVEMEDAPHDNDPVVSSFDVYVKPHLAGDLEMYVLQFPNRDSRQQYTSAKGSEPLKMRIKPKAGMVELDVPMEANRNYDKRKGLEWGSAMKKSAETKGNGSYGLPGGFGIGAAPPGGKAKLRAGIVDQEALQSQILADYQNAIRDERVLVKQTLGGQAMAKDDTTPQYMIGTFSGSRWRQIPLHRQSLTLHRSASSYTSRQRCPNAPAIPPHRCSVRARSGRSSTRSCSRSSSTHRRPYYPHDPQVQRRWRGRFNRYYGRPDHSCSIRGLEEPSFR